MGDIISDINSRRGRIEGMDDIGGGKHLSLCSACWMFGYSTDLRSKTRRDVVAFSMFFEKCRPVPKNVQEKVCGRQI